MSATLAVLSHAGGFYTARRLVDAGRELDLRIGRIDPIRVVLHAQPGRPPLSEDGRPLAVPDLVVPRIGARLMEWSLALLRGLSGAGAWSPVTPEALRRAQDKLSATQLLAAAGLPVVPTVAVRESLHVDDALEAVGGPPVVLKLRIGSQGQHVVSAPDRESAASMLGSLTAMGGTVLVQPRVRVEPPEDRRILVVGGRATAAAVRRADAAEFRSNFHQGGRMEAVAPDAESAELAEASARALDLPLCGVDLLPTPDGPAIVEVNGSPGLEGIERATGRNLAREMLVWMLERSGRGP